MRLIFILVIILIFVILGFYLINRTQEYFTNAYVNNVDFDKNYIFNIHDCGTDNNNLYKECLNNDYYILRGKSTSDFIKIKDSKQTNTENCKNYCKNSSDTEMTADFAEYVYNKNEGDDNNMLNSNFTNCKCLKSGYQYIPTLNNENISQESVLIGLTNYYELNDNIEVYIRCMSGEYLYFDNNSGIIISTSFNDSSSSSSSDGFLFKIQKSKSFGYDSYYKILPKYINGTENFSSVVYFTGSKLKTCFDSDSQKEIVLTENSNQVMVGNPGEYFNECHMLYIYNQYKDPNNFVHNYIKERILNSVVEIFSKKSFQSVFSSRLDFVLNPTSYNKDLNRFEFDISSYGIKVTDIDYIHIYRDSDSFSDDLEKKYNSDTYNFYFEDLDDYKNYYINLTQVELLNRSGVNVLSYCSVNPSSILNDQMNSNFLIDSNITTIFSTNSVFNSGSLPSIKFQFVDIDFDKISYFYITPSIYIEQAEKKIFNIVNVLSNYYLSSLNISNNTNVTFTKPLSDLENNCDNSGKDVGFLIYNANNISLNLNVKTLKSFESPFNNVTIPCDNQDKYGNYEELLFGKDNEYTGRLIFKSISDTELTQYGITDQGSIYQEFIGCLSLKSSDYYPETSSDSSGCDGNDNSIPETLFKCSTEGDLSYYKLDYETGTSVKYPYGLFFCKYSPSGISNTISENITYLNGDPNYYDSNKNILGSYCSGNIPKCISGDGTGFVKDINGNTSSCDYINIHFYYSVELQGFVIYTYKDKNKTTPYYLGFDTSQCKPGTQIVSSNSSNFTEYLDPPNKNNPGILKWATEDDPIWKSKSVYTWKSISITQDNDIVFSWNHPKMWTGYGDNLSEQYTFYLTLSTYDQDLRFNDSKTDNIYTNQTGCYESDSYTITFGGCTMCKADTGNDFNLIDIDTNGDLVDSEKILIITLKNIKLNEVQSNNKSNNSFSDILLCVFETYIPFYSDGNHFLYSYSDVGLISDPSNLIWKKVYGMVLLAKTSDGDLYQIPLSSRYCVSDSNDLNKYLINGLDSLNDGSSFADLYTHINFEAMYKGSSSYILYMMNTNYVNNQDNEVTTNKFKKYTDAGGEKSNMFTVLDNFFIYSEENYEQFAKNFVMDGFMIVEAIYGPDSTNKLKSCNMNTTTTTTTTTTYVHDILNFREKVGLSPNYSKTNGPHTMFFNYTKWSGCLNKYCKNGSEASYQIKKVMNPSYDTKDYNPVPDEYSCTRFYYQGGDSGTAGDATNWALVSGCYGAKGIFGMIFSICMLFGDQIKTDKRDGDPFGDTYDNRAYSLWYEKNDVSEFLMDKKTSGWWDLKTPDITLWHPGNAAPYWNNYDANLSYYYSGCIGDYIKPDFVKTKSWPTQGKSSNQDVFGQVFSIFLYLLGGDTLRGYDISSGIDNSDQAGRSLQEVCLWNNSLGWSDSSTRNLLLYRQGINDGAGGYYVLDKSILSNTKKYFGTYVTQNLPVANMDDTNNDPFTCGNKDDNQWMDTTQLVTAEFLGYLAYDIINIINLHIIAKEEAFEKDYDFNGIPRDILFIACGRSWYYMKYDVDNIFPYPSSRTKHDDGQWKIIAEFQRKYRNAYFTTYSPATNETDTRDAAYVDTLEYLKYIGGLSYINNDYQTPGSNDKKLPIPINILDLTMKIANLHGNWEKQTNLQQITDLEHLTNEIYNNKCAILIPKNE